MAKIRLVQNMEPEDVARQVVDPALEDQRPRPPGAVKRAQRFL